MKQIHAVQLAAQSLRRHRLTYSLSSLGIVAGVTSFIFFVGLAQGVKSVVLGQVFPIDRIEVARRTFDVGPVQLGGVGSALGASLDDQAVQALGGIPGVTGAFPKQKLAFKTMGWAGAELFGRDVRFEVFADGIAPGQLGSEAERLGFDEKGLLAEAEGPSCDPRATSSCDEGSYCVEDTGHCATPIPVLVSPHLLEMYNGSAVRAFGTPRLSPETLVGLGGTLQFGRSFAGREKGGPVLRRRARIVGMSDKAILFGATIPLPYVRHYNRIYRGAEGAQEYDSVVLQVAQADQLGAVAEAAQGMGFDLDERSRDAQRAGMMIAIVTLAMSLLTLAVIAIAALHVTHTFFMLVLERRHELALLRALGGSRRDIRRIVLYEAISVGAAAGLCGVGLARGAGWLVDRLATSYLPAFPFRPSSYFVFPTSLLLTGVASAILFCVLGALLPAHRAGRLEPAEVLTEG